MQVYTLEREQFVPRPRAEVFAFFSDAGNLDLLTPSWLRFRISTPQPIAMGRGTVIEYRLRYRGFPMSWKTLIEKWKPDEVFVDRALRSPYRLWVHTHTFELADGGTRIRDHVAYALPFGPLGAIAHAVTVRRDVHQIFDYRRAAIARRFPPAEDEAGRNGRRSGAFAAHS